MEDRLAWRYVGADRDDRQCLTANNWTFFCVHSNDVPWLLTAVEEGTYTALEHCFD